MIEAEADVVVLHYSGRCTRLVEGEVQVLVMLLAGFFYFEDSFLHVE